MTSPAAYAAMGICMLWLLALRDYAVFHLLDYPPLQLGLAAYCLLDIRNKPAWRARRF